VSGNPRDSKWFSTPRKKRRRPGIQVTLSAPALKRLAALAKEWKTTRSKVLERLLLSE
jgi:hypothetical protein